MNKLRKVKPIEKQTYFVNLNNNLNVVYGKKLGVLQMEEKVNHLHWSKSYAW